MTSKPSPEPNVPPADPIVGIDLGTTNSLVAYCDDTGPRLLHGPDQSPMLPSVVRFDPHTGQSQAIGDDAQAHAVEFAGSTVYSVKRLMGRSAEDLQSDLPFLSYAVVPGEHDTARVQVGEHVISPQHVSALILEQLKARAEQQLGCKVTRAVITVPAYFDDAQRQATRDAGRLAGLKVLRMVNEPTAAALAYNMNLASAESDSSPSSAGMPSPAPPSPGSVVQRDESTGHVSLSTKFNPDACTPAPGTPPTPGSAPVPGTPPDPGRAPVPASEAPLADHESSQADRGDAPARTVAVFDLGGGTFDISILRLMHTEQGLVDQVLSTSGDTHLGGDDVDRMIVALILDELAQQFGIDADLAPSTQQAIRSFARAAKQRLSDHDEAQLQIDLGGGRLYQRTLTRDQLNDMIAPWLERAINCCRQAVEAADLTVQQIDQVVLVGGSTRIPAVRQAVERFFHRQPYTAWNPDHVVALGAAVQASILAGINRDMLLLDVIPLSLGIETMGGAVAKLVMANQTIPAKATEMFTTYADGQTNVKIHVVQGERELVKDCRSLGEFDLTGIPPMPAGLAKIEVTFLVDANGILSVQAIEQRSGKAARIEVVPAHGLSRDEVERIESESFAHAQQDMLAHRLIDLRNQARLDIRQIQRQIQRVGDQLDPQTRQAIQQQVATVQQLAEADSPDADVFAQALTQLDHASVPLAELAIAQTLKQQ